METTIITLPGGTLRFEIRADGSVQLQMALDFGAGWSPVSTTGPGNDQDNIATLSKLHGISVTGGTVQ